MSDATPIKSRAKPPAKPKRSAAFVHSRFVWGRTERKAFMRLCKANEVTVKSGIRLACLAMIANPVRFVEAAKRSQLED